ncbi:LLM class flavin-dependent oxidoreductase [Micromonospora peucetia]|uniref:Flavin-dependent oxidoreductase, luciferase family (Includes alkanesulfonate monooxygenase SsuD and methylene tetrahydromethanopterin reductase) n=1 Tax=Micromonospora peucetia TaxID=47871 RepID=A0A1C6W2D7_9ACTN|nr:LLM class flavin-dependent oxidoreductase [Micromonospora peucetia]MCX4390965.1 LLM class flavin-dependent oxidoreductase [Micromonospora peucetia]SCL72330.1 Flavin-dependent oxidoreductase, luciferase family (includes alkanesulfonate monooxygenase SsuD and methylene tetrahydromethanopterin reductase) [Micromonospora peucetia]
MSDYGHPLTFGAFLTPGNAEPGRVVGLAMLAEQVGFDLVTFQDHPYQPAFLDTWTLMSFVAARTGSVRLAANVTNLPLRPPAVLARSVASLDLLSGGRVELGLGAGAFWEAIEAMGGRRLSPGQGVRALAEAIDVIRQVWDVDARGGVRVDGEFHRVVGAKRGPAPAHDVGIWLGAYKPRMLALTGQRADGWLPSLSYLQPGDLDRGNTIIDDAARQAGRDPADVRRLLNITGRFAAVGRGPLDGPAEQWAEELADLALSDGISTFVLGSDDPEDLRRFAAEVAPAVRELVAGERAADTVPGGTGGARTATGGTPGGTRAGVPTSATAGSPGGSGRLAGAGAFAVVPTPDDGVRRSAIRVWDETTRPTGPAPDPARTYTPHDQAGAQHLVDVHDGLRAELTRLYDLVEQVGAGLVDAGTARSHINTMTIRQNKWTLGTYCESYCRAVTTHHTLEDRGIFPHLRHGDARLAPVLDRLEQEHHAIHDVLERVDRALVAFVSVSDGMAELRAAVDLLSDTLLSHLAYEERELVEPIARLGLN